MKKYKEERWSGKGAKKGAGKGRERNMHEMLPNLALEKHAWLGAGLMWNSVQSIATYSSMGPSVHADASLRVHEASGCLRLD